MKIEEKHIKGLVFNFSTASTVEEDSQSRTVYTPQQRPLTVEDVMDTRETPDGVFFVTTDGKKYFWDRRTGKSNVAES